ncbi:UNVERIFIED_ORG: hypothetical protein J2W74_001929 [Methylorubrum zatmanii]
MADDPARDLARLRKQIRDLQDVMASGVVTVESPDGGRATYHTYAEKRQALSDAKQRLAVLEAQVGSSIARRRTRQIVVTGRSGW